MSPAKKPRQARDVADKLADAIHREHHPGTSQPYRPTEQTYRCITFDGGPNTLTYLRCLVELEKRRPGFTNRTDLFAGTSDGAFAAAFMASQPSIGIPEIERCIEMIEALLSEAIAPNRFPGFQRLLAALVCSTGLTDPTTVLAATDAPLRALSSVAGVARLLSGLSTWSDHGKIAEILARYIDPSSAACMGELPRDLVVVSYALHAPVRATADDAPRFVQRPKVFQNIDRDDQDAHQSIIDVVQRSAALPLFLPIHERHVDGAIFANNPAMCAVAAAVAQRSDPAQGRYWYLKDMVVLSMGSDDGTFGSDDVGEELERAQEHRWGWSKWLLHGLLRGFEDMMLILDIVLNSDSAGVNYQAAQLLGRRYLRIAPPGKTRTVDKFFGVLLGRVEDLKQMAKATAAVWAAEADAIDEGTYAAPKGIDRKALRDAVQAHRAKVHRDADGYGPQGIPAGIGRRVSPRTSPTCRCSARARCSRRSRGPTRRGCRGRRGSRRQHTTTSRRSLAPPRRRTICPPTTTRREALERSRRRPLDRRSLRRRRGLRRPRRRRHRLVAHRALPRRRGAGALRGAGPRRRSTPIRRRARAAAGDGRRAARLRARAPAARRDPNRSAVLDARRRTDGAVRQPQPQRSLRALRPRVARASRRRRRASPRRQWARGGRRARLRRG
jgi:hypothetical protein